VEIFFLPSFAKHFREGFVNGVATFIITDDLNVMPNCLDYASFGLLQEFGIEIASVKGGKIQKLIK
jgi:hypothetical protein